MDALRCHHLQLQGSFWLNSHRLGSKRSSNLCWKIALSTNEACVRCEISAAISAVQHCAVHSHCHHRKASMNDESAFSLALLDRTPSHRVLPNARSFHKERNLYIQVSDSFLTVSWPLDSIRRLAQEWSSGQLDYCPECRFFHNYRQLFDQVWAMLDLSASSLWKCDGGQSMTYRRPCCFAQLVFERPHFVLNLSSVAWWLAQLEVDHYSWVTTWTCSYLKSARFDCSDGKHVDCRNRAWMHWLSPDMLALWSIAAPLWLCFEFLKGCESCLFFLGHRWSFDC